MKRSPLTHTPIFADQAFAERYANRHRKMVEAFGQEYADKLSARGFRDGRIIDVGCGFGAMNLVLAQQFTDAEIVGIDLSDPLLQLAERSARAAGVDNRVRFEKGDVHQIPYDDASFDVAISTNMVHLVDDPQQMLNAIERILTPNGHLFIADVRRSWIGLLDSTFRSALTLEEARELFGSSRLRDGTFSSSLMWWRFEA